MKPGECVWGPEDAPCGQYTFGTDTLCPLHRERLDAEKHRFGLLARGLTLHFDASGPTPQIHFRSAGEPL